MDDLEFDSGPTSSKKIKLNGNILTEFPESLKEELRNAFIVLCKTKIGGIWSLRIDHCNANRKTGRRGFSFSNAYAEIKKMQGKNFYFGTVFLDGYKMLKKYLDENLLPEDKKVEYALCKLLTFLQLVSRGDDGFYGPLYKDIIKSECDIAVRFAEHFFSKLAIRSNYHVDKYYPKRDDYCRCCKKDVSEHFGDTSIGEFSVWHGHVDIVLGLSELPVAVKFKHPECPAGRTIEEVEQYSCEFSVWHGHVDIVLGLSELPVAVNFKHPESPAGRTIEEVKQYSCNEKDITSQIVAQTIVHSFIQKKKHPDNQTFLTPCVNVTEKEIQFFFYDSELDILMKSACLNLFSQKEEEEGKPNFVAILAVWFVVNYRLFCTGCTHEIKELGTSNFFEQVGSVLPVYQNELKEGGIKRVLESSKTKGADLLDEPFGKDPDEYC